jgi:ribonuclease-3
MQKAWKFLARLFARPSPPDATNRKPEHPRFAERRREFESLIGYRIRDEQIFERALIHRSSLQQHHHASTSNERLEFLGDSVLNLIVAEYLYRKLPTAAEGELTQLRSRLVNRRALATYARAIRLAEFILTSPGTSGTSGKGHETITADSFEAVIAAIYLDGGFSEARKFVHERVLNAINSGAVVTHDDNYKSMLLEYSQASGLGIPRYSIVREEGPDHDRTFTVEVALASVVRGLGTGKNKKEAEQSAAAEALSKLSGLPHATPRL